MKTFGARRTCAADLPHLFRAFADHSLAPEIVPDVTRVEFLPGPTSGAGARVEIEMIARPRGVLPRLMIPLFGRMIGRGLEEHLDHVGAWIEGRGR